MCSVQTVVEQLNPDFQNQNMHDIFLSFLWWDVKDVKCSFSKKKTKKNGTNWLNSGFTTVAKQDSENSATE